MKRYLLRACFLVAAVAAAFPLAAQDASSPADEALFAGAAGSRAGTTIGPGKVRMTMSADGRWTKFTAAWDGNESLIDGGGILVYATDEDGNPVEIVNTGRGLGVRGGPGNIPKGFEGMRAGVRAPSSNPDDDNDGRIDEDRLDGVDNDGDGDVDEDFAAIGDEMVVAGYLSPENGPRLSLHHEAYAWSLPHIDGTVMMSLRVKNTGTEPLTNVRVGAYIDRDGAFSFSDRVVRAAADPLTGDMAACRSLVCATPAGTSLGIVLLPASARFGSDWLAGTVSDAGDIGRRVLAMNALARGDASPDDVPVGTFGLPVPPIGEVTETRRDEGGAVFFLSPDAGTLAPGEETRIDLALLAVPVTASVNRAAEVALTTYLGDGTNRYLPPPVSMTPRVIWGTYRVGDDGAGVVIEFEALGEDPASADQVSFFSGTGEVQVDREELASGGVRVVLRGDAAVKAAANGERIALKGRLEGGEFFEAILRPYEEVVSRPPPSQEAELYFRTEGKLDENLLKGSPNPFRNMTTIFYEVPAVIEEEDGEQLHTGGPYETSVKIYNVVGRLVARLADEKVMPGGFAIDWPAVDDNGNPVASGVYYVKLQIEKRYITKRLILLK